MLLLPIFFVQTVRIAGRTNTFDNVPTYIYRESDIGGRVCV